MGQGLAGVAARVEAQLAAKPGQEAAQTGNPVRRNGQRGARPHARMDRKRGDLAALDDRHQEQVQRYAAMDGGNDIGLDDHRRTHLTRGKLRIESLEGAVVAGVGQEVAGLALAHAELVGMAAVAAAGDMAQLGEHAAGEPAQKLGAFGIVDAVGIGVHRLDHLRPVGHGDPHVGQRGFQRGLDVAALARIGTGGLDVDHRFAARAFAGLFRKGDEVALGIALHANDRVSQAVDHEARLGNDRGDRVDQEGHVVVDDGDAQIAALVVLRSDLDHRSLGCAVRGQFEQDVRGFLDPGAFIGRVAGQQRIADARHDGRLQRGGLATRLGSGLGGGGQIVCAHCILPHINGRRGVAVRLLPDDEYRAGPAIRHPSAFPPRAKDDGRAFSTTHMTMRRPEATGRSRRHGEVVT